MQITDNSIDLLDHRFRKDLRFRSNFDVCYLSSGNNEAVLGDSYRGRNEFPKGTVASPGFLAYSLIRCIDDALSIGYPFGQQR